MAQLAALTSSVNLRLILVASESNKRDILIDKRTDEIKAIARMVGARRDNNQLARVAFYGWMLHPTEQSQSIYDMVRILGGGSFQTDTRLKMVNSTIELINSTKPFQKRGLLPTDPRSRLFIIQPGQYDVAIIAGSRDSEPAVIDSIRLLGPDKDLDLSASGPPYSYPGVSVSRVAPPSSVIP